MEDLAHAVHVRRMCHELVCHELEVGQSLAQDPHPRWFIPTLSAVTKMREGRVVE